MRVAADDYSDAIYQPSVQLAQIVNDPYPERIDVKTYHVRKLSSPGSMIIIASNRDDRGNVFEGDQNIGSSYIATMNDQLRASQCREGLGTNQPMSI